MRRNRPGNRFAQQAGYTLVELATVLGLLGVLTLTMNSAVESMQQARLHNTSQADADGIATLVQAINATGNTGTVSNTNPNGNSERSNA